MRTLEKREIHEAVTFLSEVLSIPTVNPPGDEKSLAEYLVKKAEHYGLVGTLLNEQDHRANVKITLKGKKEEAKILLNGHLDTVPPGNLAKWNRDPFIPYEERGRIYGRGTSDMKGGLCAMIYAMKLLREEGTLLEDSIHFFGTYDEESSGKGAEELRHTLEENPKAYLFISEPTGNTISVASKGTIWLEITAYGKAAHGAYAEEGLNALEGIIAFKNEVEKAMPKKEHPHLGPCSCQLTTLVGGVKTNVVPDQAKGTLDLRLTPDVDVNAFLQEINQLKDLQNLDQKKATLTIRVLNQRRSVEIQKEHPAVQWLEKAHEAVLQEKPSYSGTNFFSDASIFTKYWPWPTVLYGPGDMREAHTPNESMCLKKYAEAIQVYYELLKNYSRWEGSL